MQLIACGARVSVSRVAPCCDNTGIFSCERCVLWGLPERMRVSNLECCVMCRRGHAVIAQPLPEPRPPKPVIRSVFDSFGLPGTHDATGPTTENVLPTPAPLLCECGGSARCRRMCAVLEECEDGGEEGGWGSPEAIRLFLREDCTQADRRGYGILGSSLAEAQVRVLLVVFFVSCCIQRIRHCYILSRCPLLVTMNNTCMCAGDAPVRRVQCCVSVA